MTGSGGHLSRAETPAPAPLSRAYEGWRALPPRTHASALALLAVLGLVRFHEPLLTSSRLIDEAMYEWAFQAVQDGRSPYDVGGYYYPPAFALAGAELERWIGAEALRYGLRTLNLLTVVATLWWAVAWWSRRSPEDPEAPRWLERVALAALLLAAAPGIALGFHLGNLSFVAIGLALLGWSLAGRHPIWAAAVLATSVTLKPIAAASLPLLVLAPPSHRARAHRFAGLVAGLVIAVTWLALPYLADLLSQDVERINRIRTWSLYRLLGVLGIDASPVIVFAATIALALALAWRWPRLRASPASWTALAAATCLLATPLIWSHTVLLFFPVLVMAATVTAQRRLAGEIPHPTWAEPAFVPLGGLVLLFYNPGAIDDLARPLEAWLLLVPLAAVVLLAAQVTRGAPSAPR